MTINLSKHWQNRIIAVSDKGVIDRADTTYDEFFGKCRYSKTIERVMGIMAYLAKNKNSDL